MTDFDDIDLELHGQRSSAQPNQASLMCTAFGCTCDDICTTTTQTTFPTLGC